MSNNIVTFGSVVKILSHNSQISAAVKSIQQIVSVRALIKVIKKISVRALVSLIKIFNVKSFDWINTITGSVTALVEPTKYTVTVTDLVQKRLINSKVSDLNK